MECDLLISKFRNSKTADLVNESIRHISSGSSPHSANTLKHGLKKAFDLKSPRLRLRRFNGERTTRLNAAPTKPNAVSEAEIVGMVDNLNTLICSVSGALSDTWDQREPIPGITFEESDFEQIQINFGDLVARQIAARDTVAVNLAIQMYLSQFIKQITSGWGSGQAAGILAKIYEMVSTKGKFSARS